jgi:hypothetical protein
MRKTIATKKNIDLKRSDTISLVGIVLNRVVIGIVALLFFYIGIKNLTDPVERAHDSSILLSTAGAITVARVAFGAFPFGFAAILATSLFSMKRLFFGVYANVLMIGILTLVRIQGLIVDGYDPLTVKILRPEIVLTVLSLIGLYLELRRRRMDKIPELTNVTE